VPVLMGYCDSEPVLLAGAVSERAGIPFVTPGATSPLLPGQVGPGLFLACFGDNTQAAAGAEYMLEQLAARTAWLVVDEATTYTVLLGRYFRAAYEHGGGRILAASRYRSGDPGLSAQLAQLAAAGARPDAVYLAALPDDVGRLVAALRKGGIDQPIVGGDGYDTPQLTRIGGAAADNVHYATHVFMSKTGRPEIARFYRAYQAAYRRSPHNAFAALGYDTVGLIADAIGRAGSAEPAAIQGALAATKDYPALTGSITYPPGQRIPDKPVAIVRIEHGQPALAAEIRPSWTPAP
jgi:branched-chain amino acid transport system substrate-binding protein